MIVPKLDEMPPTGGKSFQTTHWNVVYEAKNGSTTVAQEALGQLCQTYWPPVYLHIRRCGHDPHDAEDLTQQFFAELLGRDFLASVEQCKGRFRSFLLACLKNFLSHQRHRRQTLRRGGAFKLVPFDEALEEVESRVGATERAEDAVFDRDWALHILRRALRVIEAEQRAAGRSELFEALRPALTSDAAVGSYEVLAARLGTTPGALKVTMHRLRARFRSALMAEVAGTIAVPADLADEMRHLLDVLRVVSPPTE